MITINAKFIHQQMQEFAFTVIIKAQEIMPKGRGTGPRRNRTTPTRKAIGDLAAPAVLTVLAFIKSKTAHNGTVTKLPPRAAQII
jgi:hypothetical protein